MTVRVLRVTVHATTGVTSIILCLRLEAQLGVLMGHEKFTHAIRTRTEGTQFTATVSMTEKLATPAAISRILWPANVRGAGAREIRRHAWWT